MEKAPLMCSGLLVGICGTLAAASGIPGAHCCCEYHRDGHCSVCRAPTNPYQSSQVQKGQEA